MTSREESIPGAGMHGYTEVDKKEDVKVLHSMGYAQELERRLSRFSNFAVSFSIICILSGGINSLAQATSGAGGIAIGIGWLVGCFVSLVFAVAMSQISSAYPTAGGLYHWGSILGNRGTGWVTAWLNLLGLITVLGAINVGTWTFFVGAFGPALGIENNLTNQTIFLIIITGAQALINHLGIRLTAIAHGLLRLADLRRLDPDRGRLPDRGRALGRQPAVHLHQLFRRTGRQRLAAGLQPVGLPARLVAADLHHHRLRRLGAYVGGDAEGGAIGAAGDGDVGRLVGDLRLPLPLRLRADDPQHG